jgi:hypothetical protein
MWPSRYRLLDSIPWHTGIGRTLPLTETTVSTNSPGSCEFAGTRPGVHGDGLADDEAICDELPDGLAGVGVGDLADLVGIKPNLALSAADDGGRQALLGGKIDPIVRRSQLLLMMSRDAILRPTRAGFRSRIISSRGGEKTRRAVCLHLD